MRYIRVINDLGDEYLTTYKDHCEMVAELQDSGFDFEGCIIKQADNIEELFDEYILVDKVYSVNPDVKDKMLRKCFGKEAFKKELIYGAIWCKGEDNEPILKSVARMIDENGGWELI